MVRCTRLPDLTFHKWKKVVDEKSKDPNNEKESRKKKRETVPLD